MEIAAVGPQLNSAQTDPASEAINEMIDRDVLRKLDVKDARDKSAREVAAGRPEPPPPFMLEKEQVQSVMFEEEMVSGAILDLMA